MSILASKARFAALVLSPTLAMTAVHGETIFESFEAGFGPWTDHAYLPCQTPPDCPQLDYSVNLSPEQANDGVWSLDVTANGLHDDGTVWIQRPIELTPGTWDIELEFQLFSFPSEINNWEVVAYIGLAPPKVEGDFALIGYTGLEGWSAYSHEQPLVVEESTTAYVALGYNIVWETIRTHWFDSVTISGVPPQPPCTPGDLDSDGVVGILDLLALLAAWGSDPAGPPDFDGDGTVGILDLLTLLANWGPCP
ncbi:MAG: hypothetical protein O6933_08860 [Planctomycetota bacterium]|nr:hypothetical protein [Planctomycetota bacterium]